MLQAQEMFTNSNKLTRPEKALILGFIAGSRGALMYFIFNIKQLVKCKLVLIFFSVIK